MQTFSLRGKHALVTGARGPLARAAAVALAEAGATVSVTTLEATQRDEVAANSILNECWAAGSQDGQARTIDLLDAAAVEEAVAALEAAVGPVDILVNAAHVAGLKPVLESTLDDWNGELGRNATAVFVPTLAVGRRMVERGRGRVVNFVSDTHDRGIPRCALYAASQGAVLGFSRSLASEWGRADGETGHGVTVNVIALGFIEGVPGPHDDPEVASTLERYVPLPRVGQPGDVREAVVYLASDHASFVNGQTIAVHGDAPRAIVHHG